MSSTAFSIHYDKIFLIHKKHYLNYSAGIGIGDPIEFFNKKRFTIPASINYTTGLKNHHFEMGGGLVYLNHAYKSGVLVGFRFGYKFQTDNLYFRVSSAPSGYILVFNEKTENGTDYRDIDLYNSLFGISVGYSFN